MVSAVQYLNQKLGINLNRPASMHYRSQLLPEFNVDGDRDLLECDPKHYLGPIYNAVVGVHEENATGFDRGRGEVGKLGVDELRQLVSICRGMLSRGGNTNGQKLFLNSIIKASVNYIMLLDGGVDVIKKDAPNVGNRHTLVRAESGKIYEMTNSMTRNEVRFFKDKTKLTVRAVERPRVMRIKDGEIYSKIEMGIGSFGKTRIARNIDDDQFVAVKKKHPKLEASMSVGFIAHEPSQSNFKYISSDKQRAIKSISQHVISPDDECQMWSRKSTLAQEMNDSEHLSADEVDALIANNRLINHSLLELGDDVNKFLLKMREGRFSGYGEVIKSNYTFSELGVATVSAVIEELNVLRTYFELKCGSTLSPEASNLLGRHEMRFLNLGEFDANDSAEYRDRMYRRLGKAYFEAGDFGLKDPVSNQKFLNTLGKKMLTALSELNGFDISHQDIKPSNIVFCQDKNGLISVKLIDIDFIRNENNEVGPPDCGSEMYMPPEAFISERDGSISYTGEKGDAYAMGLTLRETLGFSCAEVLHLSEVQKNKVLADRLRGHQPRSTQIAYRREIANKMRAINVIGDVLVQNQSHVKAVSKVAPEALNLKDMSDLMLKEHAGKRYSAKEILQEYPFFKDQKNLMSDVEFSNHFHEISRFSLVTNDVEIDSINDGNLDGINKLIQLRQAAMKEMILARGQSLAGYQGGSLSKKEASKVKAAERELQTQAGVRRLGQSVAGLFSPAICDAEKVVTYKRR